MMDQIPDLKLVTPSIESLLPLVHGSGLPDDIDSLQRYAELAGLVGWALAGLRYGQLPTNKVSQHLHAAVKTPIEREWVHFLWDSFKEGDVVTPAWKIRLQQVRF